MDEMNGEKIALPREWKLCRLRDIGKIISGGTPSTKEPSYWGGEVKWITPADLSGYSNKLIANGTKSITRRGLENSSARLLPKGSILFSSRAPIGYVAIAANDLCTNQGFKNIVPNSTINHEYLYYYLQASKSLAEKHSSGTTFKEISAAKFSELPIPVPPLKQQQQIVSKIEELFSESEKSIEQLKTARQQLKVYRQSVLKWAFEGRFTNEIVTDGKLPKGWQEKTLSSIAKFINGDRGKNYPNRSEYVKVGIPFINTGHIEPNGKLSLNTMHYITRQKFNTLNSGKIEKGDLLYCLRGATLGKTAIIDQFEEGAIASSLVIIRLERQISNRFVYYFLKSPLGRDSITQFDNGSAQPNLSAKSVSLYRIRIPSIKEQLRVVEEIESRLSVADKLEQTITDSLQRAEGLRQSIFKKAFEGKLT